MFPFCSFLMSTRKLLGDVRKEGGSRWYNYSMSFLSLAQFSLHLCPGLNSARKFTKVANFRDDLVKTTKFTQQLTIFRDDLAKITKFRKSAIFRDVLAKTTKFTIFMIFRQTLRQNCQNSSPFVMLITTHPQSGAADFTVFNGNCKIRKFHIFSSKPSANLSPFFSLLYVKKNTSSKRRCRYVL